MVGILEVVDKLDILVVVLHMQVGDKQEEEQHIQEDMQAVELHMQAVDKPVGELHMLVLGDKLVVVLHMQVEDKQEEVLHMLVGDKLGLHIQAVDRPELRILAVQKKE